MLPIQAEGRGSNVGRACSKVALLGCRCTAVLSLPGVLATDQGPLAQTCYRGQAVACPAHQCVSRRIWHSLPGQGGETGLQSHDSSRSTSVILGSMGGKRRAHGYQALEGQAVSFVRWGHS